MGGPPYTVMEKCSKINYEVKRDEGRGRLKLVDSNNLKRLQQREYDLLHVCIAEEMHIDKCPLGKERCKGYNESEIGLVIEELGEVFCDTPENCDLIEFDIQVVPGSEIVSKRPHNLPVKLREGVKKELDRDD